MKGFHKRGGRGSVRFHTLIQNFKTQNGTVWARIECLGVPDNVLLEI